MKYEIECVLPDKHVLAHNQCGICGRYSDTGMRFSPWTSVSSVSIILPVPHFHSFICNLRYASYSQQLTTSLSTKLRSHALVLALLFSLIIFRFAFTVITVLHFLLPLHYIIFITYNYLTNLIKLYESNIFFNWTRSTLGFFLLWLIFF